MTEAEWLTATHPIVLLNYRANSAFTRKHRLFICAECRREASKAVREQFGDILNANENYVDCFTTVEQWRYAQSEVNAVLGSAAGKQTQAQRIREILHRLMEPLLPCYPYMAPSAVAKKPAALIWQANVVRDLFGNPFRPVAFDPTWRTSTAVAVAHGIYDDKAFDRLPILADALQDAGCENADILIHLRSDGPHVRGCWALDLALGKE